MSLLARDSSLLTGDDDKLARQAEHFNSIVNCSVEISELAVACLPDLTYHSIERASHDVPSDDDLCARLSESEICTAIHQLKKGRALGLDGISPEMLRLGRDVSVKWMKILAD